MRAPALVVQCYRLGIRPSNKTSAHPIHGSIITIAANAALSAALVPAELRAYRGDKAIKLMARDVRMLRIFHERPGQVLDRNTLCDEAWGLDFFPSSRALDMHISQLRRKIEADPVNPKIITTVRGAGYRFE